MLIYAGSDHTGDATSAPILAQVAGFQEAFWVVAGFALLALLLTGWEWLRYRQVAA